MLRRPLAFRAALVAVLLLAAFALAVPAAAQVRIGPPRPVCEETVELEGLFYLELFDAETAETRYVPVRSGRTDPVVLLPQRRYRLTLRAGDTATAPVLPARYRLESRSVLTLDARPAGEDTLPLESELSLNTHERIVIDAHEPGRRRLFLQLSECYRGGSRYFHAPYETLIPLVVVPPPGPASPAVAAPDGG